MSLPIIQDCCCCLDTILLYFQTVMVQVLYKHDLPLIYSRHLVNLNVLYEKDNLHLQYFVLRITHTAVYLVQVRNLYMVYMVHRISKCFAIIIHFLIVPSSVLFFNVHKQALTECKAFLNARSSSTSSADKNWQFIWYSSTYKVYKMRHLLVLYQCQ